MNDKSVKIADKILKLKNNKWIYAWQNIQTFDKATAIKIVWKFHKNMQINEWNP